MSTEIQYLIVRQRQNKVQPKHFYCWLYCYLASIFMVNVSAAQIDFPPNGFGPSNVGHTTINLLQGVVADAWYPTDATGIESATYPFSGVNFPAEIALADAPVSDGIFPMLFYFHGSGGASVQHSLLSETLASHGFIVVAAQRSVRTSTAIDAMLDISSTSEHFFFEAIDAEKVGLFGFSIGGSTALAANAHPAIQAVMAISPASTSRDVGIPTLLVTGTGDRLQNVSLTQFSRDSTEPRYLAVIEDAVHSSYWDSCGILDAAIAGGGTDDLIGILEPRCNDPSPEVNRIAVELTNFYGVSFFKTHLQGTDEYDQFLTQGYAQTHELPVDIQRIPLITSIPGDFDESGELDANDLDILTTEIAAGAANSRFDLTADGNVDGADLAFWVEELRETWFGDANVDGEFSTDDLVTVFQTGQYEDTMIGNSRWSTGDWNGDGDFDTSDFVVAFQGGGFEKGLRPDMTAVPEPNAAITASIILAGILLRRRKTEVQQDATH